MNKNTFIPKWNKRIETGISEIDSQHKYFLSLIHKIYILWEDEKEFESDGKTKSAQNVTSELLFYANLHTKTEEYLMKIHGYDEYESHKSKHDNISLSLKKLVEDYQAEKITLEPVIEFLIKWFHSHTADEDVRIGKFIRKKNAEKKSIRLSPMKKISSLANVFRSKRHEQ